MICDGQLGPSVAKKQMGIKFELSNCERVKPDLIFIVFCLLANNITMSHSKGLT